MANMESKAPEAKPASELKPEPPITGKAIAALALGWLAPGAGHLFVGKWKRAALLCASVYVLFFSGLAMQGRVYGGGFNDLIELLGLVGDMCSGAVYFLARALDWGAPSITTATADYGSKFIAVSGLLNVMAAIDAYHIALGKKK